VQVQVQVQVRGLVRVVIERYDNSANAVLCCAVLCFAVLMRQ
jgi:hypothetical protein